MAHATSHVDLGAIFDAIVESGLDYKITVTGLTNVGDICAKIADGTLLESTAMELFRAA